MIAYVSRDTSQLEYARTLAEAVLSLPVEIPLYTAMGRAALALRAIQRHDAEAASEHYVALKVVSGIMLLYVSTDRVLGLLAQTMGQLDRAVQHFEESLAFCRKAGYRPELAWTCCDYADALVHRNDPGDHAKATSLLEESRSISGELGMKPLMERVAVLQQLGRSRLVRTPGYPDNLSQREVEVLRLIAAGNTDREISEALVIAGSTVRRHVNNIYAKIGVNNRAEATRYALRQGLIPIDYPPEF